MLTGTPQLDICLESNPTANLFLRARTHYNSIYGPRHRTSWTACRGRSAAGTLAAAMPPSGASNTNSSTDSRRCTPPPPPHTHTAARLRVFMPQQHAHGIGASHHRSSPVLRAPRSAAVSYTIASSRLPAAVFVVGARFMQQHGIADETCSPYLGVQCWGDAVSRSWNSHPVPRLTRHRASARAIHHPRYHVRML